MTKVRRVPFSLILNEMENNESNGTNSQTNVTISTPSNVIYCSDGIIEDIKDDNVQELTSTPHSQDSEVDPVSVLNRNSTSLVFILSLYLFHFK